MSVTTQRRPSVRPLPGGSAARKNDELLTVLEVIAELKISRTTFYYWRQIRKSPPCLKLPNGGIRVRRSDLDTWLAAWENAA
jgi:predicted DNA-binding transcriptional regulator AlpA